MNIVYKFTNKYGEVLYVGKTTELHRRVREHVGSREWADSVDKIEYTEFETYGDGMIYEMYYIHKYNAIYNRGGCEGGLGTTIELPEVEWKEYEKPVGKIELGYRKIDEIRSHMSISARWKTKLVAESSGRTEGIVRSYFHSRGYFGLKARNKEAIKESILYIGENDMLLTTANISKIAGIDRTNLNKSYKDHILALSSL